MVTECYATRLSKLVNVMGHIALGLMCHISVINDELQMHIIAYICNRDLRSFEIRFEFESDVAIRFESDGPIQKFRIAAPAMFAVVP